MLLMCLEVLGEGLFFCERLRRVLQEIIAYIKDMNMKYRFKHGFTNRGYLHCAILKAFHGFQEKRPRKSRICIFISSKCFKRDFQDFQIV